MALWRDPRIWLLSLTNLTFGFSAAYMNGFVNRHYVAENPALTATAVRAKTISPELRIDWCQYSLR